MLEMIGLGVAGAAGVFGHVKSKNWVSRKLRYTSIVERPAAALGLASGGATAVAVGAWGSFPSWRYRSCPR